MSDSDFMRVYLRDCVVPLFVGIYDHEKPQAQPVAIEIEATAPLTRRYDDNHAKDMASVIDYEWLFLYVTETLPAFGHIPLLETVGERIIDFCLTDPRITHVKVKLNKPDAFKGKASVGIEMQRRRS